MKRLVLLTLILCASISAAPAATPEQEKTFVAAYKKAFEANDTKALEAFLFTKGAQAETLDFFKMMQSAEAGKKIARIELVTPDAKQLAKLNQPMEMPDGKLYKMPITPKKQLVIVIEEKDGDSTGTSTSMLPVAEKDGQLVIPVPVPA
jgi:hypothetical protein